MGRMVTGEGAGPGELLTAPCSVQHVALCVKLIAAWYIPDVPLSVKNTFLGRKHSDLRKELRWVMSRVHTGPSLQQIRSMHSRAPQQGVTRHHRHGGAAPAPGAAPSPFSAPRPASATAEQALSKMRCITYS